VRFSYKKKYYLTNGSRKKKKKLLDEAKVNPTKYDLANIKEFSNAEENRTFFCVFNAY